MSDVANVEAARSGVGAIWPALNRLCAAALLAFVVWSLASEAVRSQSLGPSVRDDYGIARHLSGLVLEGPGYGAQLETAERVPIFAYSPTYAVLHHRLLGRIPPEVATVLWMAALALAAVCAGLVGLRLYGAGADPRRFVALLLAVLACRAFVADDLHLLNSNLLAVALGLSAGWALVPAAGSRRAWGGAFALASSLAIKPVAAGLVPLLVLRRSWRAVGAVCAASVVVFAVVPIVAGVAPTELGPLLLDWSGLLARLADPVTADRMAADNVSLVAGLAKAGVSPPIAMGVSLVLRCVWLGGVGVGLWSLVGKRGGRLEPRVWATAVGMAMVAVLPLGAVLEPHHLVAAVPLALGVALAALDRRATRGWRSAHLAVLAAVFVLSSYAPSGIAASLAHFAVLGLLVFVGGWDAAAGRRRAAVS